jgi:hypothetical protein
MTKRIASHPSGARAEGAGETPETIISRALARLRSSLASPAGLIEISMSKDGLVVRADQSALAEHRASLEARLDTLVLRLKKSTKTVSIAPLRTLSAGNDKGFFRVELRLEPVQERSGISPEAAPRAPRETFEAARRALEVASRPARSVFVTRALNAVAALGQDVPESSLAAASTAPVDYGVLVRALSDPAAMEELRRADPLAPARLRGIEARQRLLGAEGGTLSVAEAAKILGVTRQAVDKRRRAGRLIGLQRGRRGYAYPAWQFTAGGTIAGLEAVLDVLRGHDPWMQVTFLLNANSRLGGNAPLAELRKGNTHAVREAALSYGEQGAV